MPQKLALFDIHTFITISITNFVILQSGLLGVFGLSIYGILIVYSLAVIFMNIRRGLHIYIHPMLLIVVAYYLFSIVCIAVNNYFIVRFSSLFQLLLLSIIAFFFRDNIDIERDISAIVKIMMISGLFVGLVSILTDWLYITFPTFVDSLPAYLKHAVMERVATSDGRQRGFLTNANETARFLNVSSMLAIYWLFKRTRKTGWNIVAIADIVLSIYMIFIATASRTSMLAFMSFGLSLLILLLILNRQNKTDQKKLFTIVAVIIAFLLIFLVVYAESTEFRSFFLEKVVRIKSLATGSGRIQVYKTALELGKGHRLFGYNPDLLKQALPKMRPPHAHNIFLQLLSFAGVPGLILYCIYMFTVTGVAIINLKNAKDGNIKLLCAFILAFITAYYVNGLTEHGCISSVKELSVIIQLLFGYTFVIRHNIKNLQNPKDIVNSCM